MTSGATAGFRAGALIPTTPVWTKPAPVPWPPDYGGVSPCVNGSMYHWVSNADFYSTVFGAPGTHTVTVSVSSSHALSDGGFGESESGKPPYLYRDFSADATLTLMVIP